MDYKAEYQAQMTALADSIREKAGTSGKMTIDQMKTAVDSISTGGTPPVLVSSTKGYCSGYGYFSTSTSNIHGIIQFSEEHKGKLWNSYVMAKCTTDFCIVDGYKMQDDEEIIVQETAHSGNGTSSYNCTISIHYQNGICYLLSRGQKILSCGYTGSPYWNKFYMTRCVETSSNSWTLGGFSSSTASSSYAANAIYSSETSSGLVETSKRRPAIVDSSVASYILCNFYAYHNKSVSATSTGVYCVPKVLD